MTSITFPIAYNYQNNKITLLNFRLNQKLKQALPIHLSQKSDDTVTFQKRKHQFTDSKTETELIELLQDI